MLKYWHIFLVLILVWCPAIGISQEIPTHGGAEQVTEIYQLLKSFRAQNQVNELNYDVRLGEVAEFYKKMLMERGSNNLDQSAINERVRTSGYGSTTVQMVIAGGSASPEKFMENWSKSELGATLKDKKFVDIGLAYLDGRMQAPTDPNGKLPKDTYVLVIGAPSQPFNGNWEQKIIELVNDFRKEHNLPSLVYNPALSKAAQYHADDMAIRDYFSHFSPEKRDVSHRVSRSGYRWQKVSENLAAGQSTPIGVVNGWKASKDGHREAMIDPNVTEAGVGYRYIVADTGKARFSHYWALVMAKPIR